MNNKSPLERSPTTENRPFFKIPENLDLPPAEKRPWQETRSGGIVWPERPEADLDQALRDIIAGKKVGNI